MSENTDGRNELIGNLRLRLAEAEETLQAIRRGEVDALVVRQSDREEIFTIEGASAYKKFMEAMDPGAVALDSDGRILYANGKVAKLLGQNVETLQGYPIFAFVEDNQGKLLKDLMQSAGSLPRTKRFLLQRPSGPPVHADVSVTQLQLGTVSGFAVIFSDTTERVRAEVAEQSEQAARAVIDSANEAVIVCDRNGVITHANGAADLLSASPIVGKLFAEAVPLVFPGATGLVQAEDVVATAIGGNGVRGIEAVAPKAPKVKDYIVSVAPLRVSGEEISGCVVTLVDLSPRKAAEKQQLLLMAELDHRVKNTLALVQSICARTLSSEQTLEGFGIAFSGRLHALAATHNLLAERSWTNLRLTDIITSELAPYVDAKSNRISVTGLDFVVAPRAAIAVGLILHELSTNAVKYGALSNDGGCVIVRLGEARRQDAPVIVEWRETGGPPVVPPSRRGFGGTVITRSLQYSPQGNTELSFEPSGVVCRISIPSEDII